MPQLPGRVRPRREAGRWVPALVARRGALEELERLPGIGPFSAELILLRGAGEPDYLPEHEPRLARDVAIAYGLEEPPGVGELRKLAECWRPYRTWVSLCLRAMLEEETREISGNAGL